jgi:hypothetical protein
MFNYYTLHKWSGIEDGRHLDEELIHLVKTDERFLSAKNNIETVQTLIVDEISMIGQNPHTGHFQLAAVGKNHQLV